MSWRNRIFPKKRGRRRTGGRMVGHWSELLLSGSLVVVGAVTLTLHLSQVLLPEWRESQELDEFRPGWAEITAVRIFRRESPLAVGEYGLDIQASRITDEGLLPPVWVERGLATHVPSRGDAEHLARSFEPGTRHRVWYDPDDPQRLILRRSFRWWLWLVALIPTSLIAVGGWGIVASLMQVATSAERRSLVAVRAARFDPLREGSQESATMPATDAVGENPGVRFAHRLPMVGAAAWRLAGLFLVCAIWNALSAYFGFVASQQYFRGDPPWLALGLVVLLGMVGVWLAFHVVRELWDRRGIGITQMEVSAHPLALGGEYRAYLLQTGRMELRELSVALVCEEVASYLQGTDSRTSIETVHREKLRKWRRLSIEPGASFEADLTFRVPAAAMHSFRAPHNQVRWLFLVHGVTSRGQELSRRFPLSVRTAVRHAPSASEVAPPDERDASTTEALA